MSCNLFLCKALFCSSSENCKFHGVNETHCMWHFDATYSRFSHQRGHYFLLKVWESKPIITESWLPRTMPNFFPRKRENIRIKASNLTPPRGIFKRSHFGHTFWWFRGKTQPFLFFEWGKNGLLSALKSNFLLNSATIDKIPFSKKLFFHRRLKLFFVLV